MRKIIRNGNAQIAYEVQGHGKAILMLHGFGTSKERYTKTGWVEDLKSEYKVIAMDLRGHGESSSFHNWEAYTLEQILSDIRAVFAEEAIQEAAIFGHSFGGSVALRGILGGLPVTCGIIASGTWEGDFFQKDIPVWIDEYKVMQQRKIAGNLEGLSEEDAAWLLETDLESALAQFQAWTLFEEVKPEDIRIPIFVYSGTADEPRAVAHIQEYQAYFEERGWQYRIYEGMDHRDLVLRNADILPDVQAFLKKQR